MPEKVLKKINARIFPTSKICFLAALLVGFIAHLYKITSWLPNWDSLVFRYDAQNMIALGRWFLPVVCSVSSFYDLPFLNGIIAIVFHALGAVCISRIFNVQKKITAFLIGAVVISFPTVTSVMMYNYVSDGYAVSFFLSTLAVFFMTKEKPRYIVSLILIALSIGIYQAYITVAIMLILLKLIDEMVFYGASFRTVLKKAGNMLITGIAGAALYGVILKVVMGVFSAQLLDYQGISDAASLSNINIPASLYLIKQTFIRCFFDISNGINLYVLLNAFMLVFTFIYYAKYILKNKIYKKPLNILLIVILSILLIVGAAALAFVNAGIDYHNLMLMGYSVFYLFFLLLYERGIETKEKCASAKSWTVLLTALVVILNQIIISNVSYHKAQIAYEKSYGVLIRIADRIEQTAGAENCDKILVLGALDNSDDYSVNLTPDITGITDGYIIRADDETVGQSVLTSALNDYCGNSYEFLKGEEKRNLAQKEEVKSMNKWPARDSVAVVENTIVIKLGTEGEY